jgi:tRNA 5-methylaminomethyl-2-thiouridine biosynthesis bifunctional protein
LAVIPFAPLTAARPEYDERGVLRSPLYGDVYASADGALAQAAHVFLRANGLPERWQAGRSFVLLETGFGAGINFLATWQAFRSHAPEPCRLHYLAVEKHPFSRDDLQSIWARTQHGRLPVDEVLERYPPLIAGMHRLHLDDGRVSLTLIFGDVEAVLPEVDARVDAFYLDGFAPSRNPQMWSPTVFAQVARLAAPGATASTYTVAGSVRERLQAVGFTVRKAPGFGSKNEMLCARFEGRSIDVPPRARTTRAVVIGAGLAGSACAAALASRGVDVQVIEQHGAPAQEASGNPAGLVMPAFSQDWNPATRLTVAALLHARRELSPLAAQAWFDTGVLQLARDASHEKRHANIIERFALPPEVIRMASAEEGSALVGSRVAANGWWLAGGWADPAAICRYALRNVPCVFDRRAGRLARGDDGDWQVFDAEGKAITAAPWVIVANAHAARRLLPEASLPLGVTRGQISRLPQRSGAVLRAPVCREGYITPAFEGMHCIGASYQPGTDDVVERPEDTRGNLDRLERLLPGYAAGVDPAGLTGRAALRTVAPDRMPVVGAFPGAQNAGLLTCLALASRGITYAPLLAEAVACLVTGEPSPLEAGLVRAVAPGRFAGALQTQAGT